MSNVNTSDSLVLKNSVNNSLYCLKLMVIMVCLIHN